MRHFKKHIPLSQRKRFQCENCKEKFISNSNLKTHTKVCTGVVKTYTCKRCKSEFNNKTDYEDHLAVAHNVGRNHECHICHKQLRRAGDVKKHMLTHNEGKPYVCDICGKRFRTESYVKVRGVNFDIRLKFHYISFRFTRRHITKTPQLRTPRMMTAR